MSSFSSLSTPKSSNDNLQIGKNVLQAVRCQVGPSGLTGACKQYAQSFPAVSEGAFSGRETATSTAQSGDAASPTVVSATQLHRRNSRILATVQFPVVVAQA